MPSPGRPGASPVAAGRIRTGPIRGSTTTARPIDAKITSFPYPDLSKESP